MDANGKQVDDYWLASKKMLSDLHFLDSLLEFDKDNIPNSAIKNIRKNYVPNPAFVPELVKHSSSACEGLCKWVRAIEVYDKVAKVSVCGMGGESLEWYILPILLNGYHTQTYCV